MWYAVHSADGELLSITTLLPDDLRPELAFVELGETKPDWSELAWDPAKLSMTPKPPPPIPKDRLDDLETKVPALSKLNPVELGALKTEVGLLLGDARYEEVVVEASVEAVK